MRHSFYEASRAFPLRSDVTNKQAPYHNSPRATLYRSPCFPSLSILPSPDTLTDKFTDAAYLAGPSSMHKLPRDWRRVPDRRPGKVRVLRYIRHGANSQLTTVAPTHDHRNLGRPLAFA